MGGQACRQEGRPLLEASIGGERGIVSVWFFSASLVVFFIQGGTQGPTQGPRLHLHNTFTSEGRAQIGSSPSISEAQISTMAIRNLDRMTEAQGVQLPGLWEEGAGKSQRFRVLSYE